MPVRPRTGQIREAGGRLPQSSLVLTAMVALGAALIFGVPKSAFWHDSLPSSGVKVSTWAGHLENPAEKPAPVSAPLTSASYTSGFDKVAAGLAPEPAPPKPQQDIDNALACPAGLNCAFRTVKAAPEPPNPPATAVATANVGATPSTAPASAGAAPVASVAPPARNHPNAFGAIVSRLPSPRLLLKPFTFVAETFTGLVKKL